MHLPLRGILPCTLSRTVFSYSVVKKKLLQTALTSCQCKHHLLSSFSTSFSGGLKSEDVTESHTTEESGSSSSPAVPVLMSRKLKFMTNHTYPRLAWLESMSSLEGEKLGMLDLHPDVFATYPRLDMLHKNVHWQQFYKHIDYSFMKSRAEMRGGGRKPWPQKGTGRARHGSIRSPLWVKGAKAHGPRGPTSYFYMLPRHQRAQGLRVALSCKYAQNDLVIVDSLDLPTSDPEYLSELADVRFWGYSVLFVDDTDEMPENMAVAQSQIRGFSLMPAYGLNVYSMLKHETLVLTLAALERIEGKLLQELHTTERNTKFVNTRTPEDFRTKPKEDNSMYKKFSEPLEY